MSSRMLAYLIDFTFHIAIYTASYHSSRILTTPNPSPTLDDVSDSIYLLGCLIFNLSLSTYHALLAYNLSFPSPTPTLFCSNPENLNASLFTWTRHSTLCIAALLLAAYVRLLAFQDLGPRPQQNLITTGLYAYVQHPMDTAEAVISIANIMLFRRSDGVFGCLLEEKWAQGLLWGMTRWGCLFTLVWLAKRVIDEERILKMNYGTEWEQWHRRTWRCIPGLF